MKLQGASGITLDNVAVGTQVSTVFKTTKTLEQQLQKQANELLNAYYSKKNVSEFLSSDSDVETMLKVSESSGNVGGISQPLGTMHNDLILQTSSLDDSTHANNNIQYTVNIPIMSMDNITILGNPQNTVNKTIYFEKVGNKWLICSVDLYN